MDWTNKLNRKIRGAIFVCAALFIFAAASFGDDFFKGDKIDESLQRELVIFHSMSNLNLDPHTSAYVFEAQILNGVYEGLFSYNAASLEPDNALAKDFRISRDKFRWTFTIRQGAKSSSGIEITAQTIKDSWLNLIANKGAYYSSLLDVIKGAREYRLGTGKREDVAIYASGQKLSVELVKPTSHFNKLLCHHAFSAVLDDSSASGAYMIESVTPFKVQLKKNPNYWNAEQVHIPSIAIHLTDDSKAKAHAFNTGAADWIDGTDEIKRILDKKAIQLSAEFGTEYLFFKNDSPIWSQADFRNAVLTAVPWKQLRDGSMFPAETLVCPSAGYKSPEGLNYTDAEEAKLMLDAAKRKAGIADEQKIQLLFAIPDTEYLSNRAELLRGALEEIGVELKTVKIPQQLYLTSIASTKADLFLYTWIGDYSDPLAFLELFRGNSSMNDSHWIDQDFDKLLDQAAWTNESKERNALLAKAEDILLSSGEVIPISHPVTCAVIDLNSVGGWVSNAMDIHPFKSIYFKKVEETFKNVVMR
ncbi:MAG: peptide ABC transporter substrate-binding protein [Treponema sp.]|nr:peptide ABC transporter substrate-binding protein [Treponema sp.]